MTGQHPSEPPVPPTEAGQWLVAELCNCGGPSPEWADIHPTWCRAWPVFLSLPDIEEEARREQGAQRDRLRSALVAISQMHEREPDGGMGCLSDGHYGHYDNACVTCGQSDEYAVEWPCETRKTADAALIDDAELRAALSDPTQEKP